MCAREPGKIFFLKTGVLKTVDVGVREGRLYDKRNKETQDDKLSKSRSICIRKWSTKSNIYM